MLLNAKSNPSRRSPAASAGFLLIEAPRNVVAGIVVAFLGLVLVAGAIGFWLASRTTPKPTEIATAKTLPNQVAPTYTARPGPWGDLQCQRTILEVPEEYLGVRNWESEPMQWFFRGYTPTTLQQLFTRLELTAAEIADLTNSSKWQITTDGVAVMPELGTVLSLAAPVRNALYAELAKSDENVMQQQPFHWPMEEVTELFASTRAAPESITTFRKLCYERGKFLLFSDWKALLSALPNPTERNAVAQALMGRFALFASVRITPQTDVEALVQYWGAGGNSKHVRPILEAAARAPSGMNVSLGSLMPPQVRARIYTFPFTKPNEQLNCHWTAFNFFNEQPEPPANLRYWRDKLQADYQPVTEPRFGDILVLLKPDNSIVHSCVYLAEEIVYTKNGGSPFAPWQLATMPDLLHFYSWDLATDAKLKTAWYRKRS